KPFSRERLNNLERATHPLARLGDPLHHRTEESPQCIGHSPPLCAKTQLLASERIRKSAADPTRTNSHKLSKPMESSYTNPPAFGGVHARLCSLQFKGLLESANSHVEDAWLDDPFVVCADERQVVGRQIERDLAVFAGL